MATPGPMTVVFTTRHPRSPAVSPTRSPRVEHHIEARHLAASKPRVLPTEEYDKALLISHCRRDPAALNVTYAFILALRCERGPDGNPFSRHCHVDNRTVELWTDKEQLASKGGEDWQIPIIRAILHGISTVCFIGNAYCASGPCQDELRVCVSNRKHIIPFFIERLCYHKDYFDEWLKTRNDVPDHVISDRDLREFEEWQIHRETAGLYVNKLQGVDLFLTTEEMNTHFLCDICRATRDERCPNCTDWRRLSEIPVIGKKLVAKAKMFGKFIDAKVDMERGSVSEPSQEPEPDLEPAPASGGGGPEPEPEPHPEAECDTDAKYDPIEEMRVEMRAMKPGALLRKASDLGISENARYEALDISKDALMELVVTKHNANLADSMMEVEIIYDGHLNSFPSDEQRGQIEAEIHTAVRNALSFEISDMKLTTTYQANQESESGTLNIGVVIHDHRSKIDSDDAVGSVVELDIANSEKVASCLMDSVGDITVRVEAGSVRVRVGGLPPWAAALLSACATEDGTFVRQLHSILLPCCSSLAVTPPRVIVDEKKLYGTQSGCDDVVTHRT